jgi:phenylpyruvate tautomerase
MDIFTSTKLIEGSTGIWLILFHMPLVIIKTNVPEILPEVREAIHEQGQAALSSILQKSRDYVLSLLELGQDMSFAGNSSASCVYVEIKNVGTIKPEISLEVSKEITRILNEHLGADPKRVYIEFQQSERHLWGWAGKTFA